MFITVAICTFNRADSLRRTLDSLGALELPTGLAWELVVVNNKSTDHTDDVIGEYWGRLPVRRELEPRPGLSNARNRAIDVAKGEYIVWTDDDVVVDPGWLRAYAEAFRRWPEAAVFGGRIIPRYETPAAKWVLESEAVLGGPYAIRDFGEESQLSIESKIGFPYGANFAIRAKEQRAFLYNPDLGLAPNRRRLDDETDVIKRVLRSGAQGYWIPGALVEHCIGKERQTVRYVSEFFGGLGETDAFNEAATGATPPVTLLLFGVPRRLWLQVFKRWLCYRYHRFVSPAPVWARQLRRYGYARGMFQYWWRKNR
jgi:glycosyltransferase involved in cell wall biosynthesis